MQVTRRQLQRVINEYLSLEGDQILSEGVADTVREIQVMIKQFPDIASATGRWTGSGADSTDKYWYEFIAAAMAKPGWADAHGAASEPVLGALRDGDIRWTVAAKIMSDAGISGMTPNPDGALAMLKWIERTAPAEVLDLVDGAVADEFGISTVAPARAERQRTVRRGEEQAQDVRIQDPDLGEMDLDVHTRRKGKVHILTPEESGDSVSIPGFKYKINRINIYLYEPATQEELEAELQQDRPRGIRKMKVNRRWLRVFNKEKKDGILSVLKTGVLVDNIEETEK